MRFQCLSCNKQFGWTAKKTVSKILEGYDLPVTMEYIVCPYCEGFDFEEYVNKPVTAKKPVPKIQYPKQVSQFDPADLMQHSWKKGKRKPDKTYDVGSLAYGWDFKDQFKPETLDALAKEPIDIDHYEFALQGNFVSTKKVNQ